MESPPAPGMCCFRLNWQKPSARIPDEHHPLLYHLDLLPGAIVRSFGDWEGQQAGNKRSCSDFPLWEVPLFLGQSAAPRAPSPGSQPLRQELTLGDPAEL